MGSDECVCCRKVPDRQMDLTKLFKKKEDTKLRSIIFAIGAIAATSVGLIVTDEIRRKGGSCVKEEIRNAVVKARKPEDLEVVKLLGEYRAEADELNERENAEIEKQLNEYAAATGYHTQKKEIEEAITKKVSEFKEEIGYEQAKANCKKAYDELLEDWKKDNNYISRIQSEKDKISEIERIANNQKFMANIMTDNSEFGKEASSKIKATIKETKKEEIKKSEKAIKKIEGEYEDFKKGAKAAYDADIAELNKKVNAVREEAVKQSNDSLRELNKAYKDKEAEITDAVISKRTDEEKDLVFNVEKYTGKYRQLQVKESQTISDKLKNVTYVDIMAAYFKKSKWSRIAVAAFLGMPIIPVAIGSYCWIKTIAEVIGKMETEMS